MKISNYIFKLHRSITWSLIFALISLLVACTSNNDVPLGTASLNSRYTEEQPALSGNGRFLAFISSRNRNHQLLVYDLESQSFIATPGLNRQVTITESPSLSFNGRYICYVTNDRGRPVIALYDRANQQSQVLTPNYNGLVKNPSISPDGRYVVFEGASRGQWDIEVLDRGPTVELDVPNGTLVN
ncbi:TolB family protein [Anabaena sp. FACHB-1237]|uniref:TolB family protein n=1 Tax=Anabaena sp. FACHB-1237 TaxID=2692769 RepID=UPI0016810E44|nr:PD40 domain-containing protein [Anabaena sp. FACHB-1237]MBD2137193.1 TolB family protein [Anabaena sp. FACHB-1237]